MVDKVEIQEQETGIEKPVEQTNETQSTQSKPEGLPEKFNSVEDLAKSYAELEKKLGGQSQETKEEVDPVAKAEPKTETKTDNNKLDIAEKAVADAGLDMSSLQQEYSEKGELDAKSYEALEKVGITKQYVDNYIAGQEAIANQQATEIKQTVGGEETYQEMVDWASKNMTEGEKQAYNKAVNSGDMDTVKLAVNALKGQFERANGVEPRLVEGKAQPSQEQGFLSWAQVTEAMADPRYAKDMAYQNEVKNKLANSNL
ncbi:scaffolding protein [Pelagibacter phage Eistla EXVC025P]|nr:scaffolding protein [Pelagibacter phage Eistla EXVC025P]